MDAPAQKIVPCVWLDDQAEAAAAFYARTFPGARVLGTSRYPTTFDTPSHKPRGSVLTVEVSLAGQRFTLLNGGPQFHPNPSVSFFVRVGSPQEVDRLYAALADGGEARMPLDAYPWSDRYAWVQDALGVSWQLMLDRRAAGEAVIVPCLMFAGAHAGRAEAAIRRYTGVFPGGRVDSLERYGPGEGPQGQVKHGRFAVAGQAMVAMDSHVAHDVTFDEGLSLQVLCADQAEVDRLWDGLIAGGGAPGPCGWLKDPYGLSWQVVPSAIDRWMESPDEAARDRAFAALLDMKKLDLARIQSAFEGAAPRRL